MNRTDTVIGYLLFVEVLIRTIIATIAEFVAKLFGAELPEAA